VGHTVVRVLALTLMTGGIAAGCDADGDTIGPRGGFVASDDGRFALEVPPGALDEDVSIEIETVDCEISATGHCYEVAPVGLGFRKPAVATFELGDMELDDTTAQKLGLVVRRDRSWRPLADCQVDPDDEVLTASALFLSSFAVVSID
jgi:hypothetical protein